MMMVPMMMPHSPGQINRRNDGSNGQMSSGNTMLGMHLMQNHQRSQFLLKDHSNQYQMTSQEPHFKMNQKQHHHSDDAGNNVINSYKKNFKGNQDTFGV